MRLRARMSLALFGLALAVPTAAPAQRPAQPGTSGEPHRHTKGLFGNKRSCTECQVKELAAQGIHIPPPPTIPNGAIVTEGECSVCQSAPVVAGPMMVQGGGAPGHAVVGGAASGYAVVGGEVPSAEPTPIGVVKPALASRVPPAAAGRPGTMDRSLTPTSMAPNPIRPKTHNDPRVISHLLGISDLGRGRRAARERKEREDHARISYGLTNSRVNEVPASVIYGRR